MDAASLGILKRSELQQLAKKNGVKANLKSNTIIELLLQRRAQAIIASPERVDRSRGEDASPAARTSISNEKAKQLAELSSILYRTLPSNSNVSDQIAEGRRDPLDGAPLSREKTPDDMELRYPSYANSIRQSLGTPDSSSAGSRTPEEAPSDVLEDVVKTFADMDARDKEILEQISYLRATTSKLREQTADLRACIRAEKGRRKRLEAFLLYWRQIGSCWTFKEVWSGKMRLFTGVAGELEMEITSSDEEMVTKYLKETERSQADSSVPPPVHSPIPGPLHDGGALEIAINPITSSLNVPSKRRHQDADDDDEEESRYSPVTRTDEPATVEGPTPPSSPLRKRVDKGKKKMSSAQVEEMLREMHGEENDSLAASSPDRRMAQVNHDLALAQVIQEEEFLSVPKAPVGGHVEIAINPITSSLNVPVKRRHRDADDDEDESRYRPVRRTDEPSTPPSSPLRKRVDKGKKKMSAAQVEEMLREMHGEENEYLAASSPDRRMAQLNHDLALAQVIQEEEFLSVPKAPAGGPIISSPPRRSTRRAASARP